MEDGQRMNGKAKDKELDEVQIEEEIQLYSMRWFILAMFMFYTVAAGVQWMQYSIISNFVMKYYGIEAYEAEWTTMLHMLAYVIFILPTLWMLEKTGNRISMLMAGGGICVGSWIKLLAVQPNAFFFVLVGQAIEAAAQVLTFALAGSVTATWFGSHEIALGGSLALFGDLLGAGLGFLLPPLFVHDSENLEEIGEGIYNLCLFISIFSTSIFVVMLIFFKDCPRKPPSNAQIVRNEVKKDANYVNDFLKMVSRKSFLLLLFTYGIHISVFNAHATLLNRIFIFYFPGHEKDAGMIGCLIIFCGLIGSVLSGLFLDWKHLFKETNCLLYICSTLCMSGYTMALYYQDLVLVYVLACALGIFMWGYYSVTLQLAFELVHPYSEGTAAGLALLAVQLISLVFTPVYRKILEHFDPLTANLWLIGLLVVGILLSFKIPAKYRRQHAENVLKSGESAKAFIKHVEDDDD